MPKIFCHFFFPLYTEQKISCHLIVLCSCDPVTSGAHKLALFPSLTAQEFKHLQGAGLVTDES